MNPRVPPPRTAARLLLAALLFLGGASAVWAAGPSFPRGPGLYYSPYKLVALVLSFWGWVRLARWLDLDANRFKDEAIRWNPLLLGVSLVALLLLWNLAVFWFALALFWLMVLGTVGLYVHVRNQLVNEDERLLTQRHLRALAKHYLPFLTGKREAEGAKGPRVPVRFISRSPTGEEDDNARVAKVQESRGYKAALDLVWDALQNRATDIHLEPADEQMAVRYRIDGVMTNVAPLTRVMGEAVINISKVLSNLDITERRKPQDGSFSAQVGKSIGPGQWTYRVVDFRVATAGSIAGEKMVMRVLDATQQLVDLSQIGMTDAMREQVRELAGRPHGMFLVCGPTGSGKTTTLYACLHEIDCFTKNVITIENPVEYRLENVTQIEVNPRAGKTFASELRSILRQDPDVIMVGEVRDKETAEIACQAAQTGHLVFTTVHANDTVTAIGRLIDLGVQPFMVASALTAVLGQRLVRRLCTSCRRRYKPTGETLKKLAIDADFVRFLYRPPDPGESAPPDDDETGEEGHGVCERCGGSGYFKRTGVFELLVITDAIREQIRANPNLQAIKQEAVANGLRTLFEDGARLVIEGETSIQELLRVSR